MSDETQQAIDAAASGADKSCEDWVEHAYGYVLGYPEKYFQADDVRNFALSCGLPEAPDPRAWGAVMRKASADGYIIPVGFEMAHNPNAHKRPVRVWQHADADD